jgi:hypothetical protein
VGVLVGALAAAGGDAARMIGPAAGTFAIPTTSDRQSWLMGLVMWRLLEPSSSRDVMS